MEIFIGNIPYDASIKELTGLLERYGRVDRIHLPVDGTGHPRGFGFATMPVEAHATAAITALDGQRLKGRPLRVNEATGGRRPRNATATQAGGRRANPPSLANSPARSARPPTSDQVSHTPLRGNPAPSRRPQSPEAPNRRNTTTALPGASVARHRLRHKTVEQPFRTVFVITILANCIGFAWLFTDDGALAQQHLERLFSEFWLQASTR